MTVMVGHLVSGPRWLEIEDLKPGTDEHARQVLCDMVSSFGVSWAPTTSSPALLSPEELREQNRLAGQKLGLEFQQE